MHKVMIVGLAFLLVACAGTREKFSGKKTTEKGRNVAYVPGIFSH